MPPAGSNKLLLALFVALAFSSVGLKATVGAPRVAAVDRRPGETTGHLMNILQRQGFSTTLRLRRFQSSIVYATRGACRLTVRDGRDAEGFKTGFSQDAAGVGPVRYLFRGHRYESPPVLTIRLVRARTAVLGLFQRQQRIPLPVALATSPGCAANDYGLGDVRVSA